MPIRIIKGSWEYCTKNLWFFSFVLILLFILEYLTDTLIIPSFSSPIVFFVLMGYGLQVTKDVIDGGVRLPKIMPKKMILYTIKGAIVFSFYVGIQLLVLSIISVYLNFPVFELEDIFVNYHETLELLATHSPVSFAIFLISGFVTVYVTSFFMELALARLADGGGLLNAFNFPRIKHAIDIIGWRRYTLGYSKIIFSVIFMIFINHLIRPYPYVNIAGGIILDIMTFVVEYRGIGLVYKVYTDSKKAQRPPEVSKRIVVE